MRIRALLTGLLIFCASLAAYPAVKPQDKVVTVTVITDTACRFCSIDKPQEAIRNCFPQVKFQKLDYRTKNARDIIAKYNIRSLPYFILPLQIKETGDFSRNASMFFENNGALALKPEIAGIFLFIGRPYADNTIDYFFDFYDMRTAKTFPVLRAFCAQKKVDLHMHFIVPDKPVFGYPEQEIKTALAIQKLYPGRLFDYLQERLQSIETIDATTSMSKMGIDLKQVFSQYEPDTAQKLFKDNGVLTKELGITNGNAILANNCRLFMIFEASKEDFAKVLNKK